MTEFVWCSMAEQNHTLIAWVGSLGESETCPVQNGCPSCFKISVGGHFLKISLRKTVFPRKPMCMVGCFKTYPLFYYYVVSPPMWCHETGKKLLTQNFILRLIL